MAIIRTHPILVRGPRRRIDNIIDQLKETVRSDKIDEHSGPLVTDNSGESQNRGDNPFAPENFMATLKKMAARAEEIKNEEAARGIDSPRVVGQTRAGGRRRATGYDRGAGATGIQPTNARPEVPKVSGQPRVATGSNPEAGGGDRHVRVGNDDDVAGEGGPNAPPKSLKVQGAPQPRFVGLEIDVDHLAGDRVGAVDNSVASQDESDITIGEQVVTSQY